MATRVYFSVFDFHHSNCALICGNQIKSMRLPDKSSMYTTELSSIRMALEHIRRLKQKSFVIYSDFLSSLQAVQSFDSRVRLVAQFTTHRGPRPLRNPPGGQSKRCKSGISAIPRPRGGRHCGVVSIFIVYRMASWSWIEEDQRHFHMLNRGVQSEPRWRHQI